MCCAICGAEKLDIANAAGETLPAALRCERCGLIVCVRCAARFDDHSGVRMLCCPACGRRGVLDAIPVPD